LDPTQNNAPGGTQLPSKNDQVCFNGGTCQEAADKTVCNCRTGFWGAKCENYDNPCLNKPCQNGGRCRFAVGSEISSGVPVSDRYWGYVCNCRYPYYGLNCENKWDPLAETDAICANNKCVNGATCYKRAYGGEGGFHATVNGVSTSEVEPYGCTCAPGFLGKYCDVQVDVCDMPRDVNPCQNGGFCATNSGSYKGVQCTCKCGWTGYRCELGGGWSAALKGVTPNLLDFCSSGSVCQNGGECLNGQNRQGVFCLCPVGYQGTFCEFKARSAAASVSPSLVVAALAAIAAVFAIKF